MAFFSANPGFTSPIGRQTNTQAQPVNSFRGMAPPPETLNQGGATYSAPSLEQLQGTQIPATAVEGQPTQQDLAQQIAQQHLAQITTAPQGQVNTVADQGPQVAGQGLDIQKDFKQTGISGLDMSNPFVKQLMTQLQGQVSQLPEQISGISERVRSRQTAGADRLLQQQLQPVIERLAQRGILDSSMGAEAISGVTSELARQLMDQNLQTNIQEEQSLARMPEVFQNLLQGLGQRRTETIDEGAGSKLMADILMST